MSTSPLPAQAKPAAGPGDDIQFPDGGGSEALRLLAAILYTVRNAPKDSMAGPFWDMYRAEAEEYDNEFLRRYGGDLDIGLLFAGLFSTVSTSFLVMMQPDLSVDPSRTTHALLRMMVHALNQTAFPDGLAELPDAWSGPSTTVIWVQSLLYASLGFSLFAALGAVLGKQWLSEYSKVGERGTVEARCRHRQRKFTGLEKWHLRTVLELVPIMLQISLLLFGVGLSAYIWDRDRILGAVVIAANGVGVLLYYMAFAASVVYLDCPFRTPITAFFDASREELLRPSRVLLTCALLGRDAAISFGSHTCAMSQHFYDRLTTAQIWSNGWLRSTGTSARPISLSLCNAFRSVRRWFSSRRPYGNTSDELVLHFHPQRPESPDLPRHEPQSDNVSSTPSRLSLFHIDPMLWIPHDPLPPDVSFALSISWIMETSSDPAVLLTAIQSIFEVDWPVTIDVFPMLTRLLVAFSDCFRAGPNGQPRLVTKREVAIASSKAFLRLYWERRYISPHEMLTRPLYGEDSVFADSSSIPTTRTSPWLGVLTIEEPDPELHFAQELMIDTMYSHLRCTVDDRPNGRHWASSQRIDLPDLPPHVLSWFSPIMAHMLSDPTFLPTSVRRTLATFIVKTLRPSLPNPEGTLLPNAKVSATPNPEVSYHLISAAFLLGYKPDASRKVNFLRSFKSPDSAFQALRVLLHQLSEKALPGGLSPLEDSAIEKEDKADISVLAIRLLDPLVKFAQETQYHDVFLKSQFSLWCINMCRLCLSPNRRGLGFPHTSVVCHRLLVRLSLLSGNIHDRDEYDLFKAGLPIWNVYYNLSPRLDGDGVYLKTIPPLSRDDCHWVLRYAHLLREDRTPWSHPDTLDVDVDAFADALLILCEVPDISKIAVEGVTNGATMSDLLLLVHKAAQLSMAVSHARLRLVTMRLLRVLLPDDSPAAMPLAVACTPESFDPFLYRLVDPYFDATVEDPMDAERRDADYAAILRALIAHTRDSNPTADWLIDNPNGFTYEHAPKCIAILEQVYQRRVTKHQLSQWNLRRNLAYILLHYAHLFSEQWLRPTGEWSRKRLPIVVVCLAWKDVNETWAIEEGILHMLIIRTLKALELVPLRSLTRRDFIKQGVGRLLQEAYNGMFCVSKGSVGNISWDQAALQEAQDRMRRRLVYLGLDALPFVSMTSEDRHSQSPRHIDWSRFRPT